VTLRAAAALWSPTAYGGVSKVAGSLPGTLRAGSRIIATMLRVAAEPSPRLNAIESR
jgi:hypothetical protein